MKLSLVILLPATAATEIKVTYEVPALISSADFQMP